MKKQTKTILLILAGILLLAVLMGRQPYSIVGQLPDVVETSTWGAIPITITSDYLGGLSSSEKITSENVPAQICGYNDPERVSLSNSYQVISPTIMSLKSSLNGYKSVCNDNDIVLEFIAPRGHLNVNYDLQSYASRNDNDNSIASLEVNGNKIVSTLACDPNNGQCNNGADVKSGMISYVLKEGDKYKIKLTTSKSYYGSASGSLTLTFKEATLVGSPENMPAIEQPKTPTTLPPSQQVTYEYKNKGLYTLIFVTITLISLGIIAFHFRKKKGRR